jgi:hypothetical protein
MTGVGGWEQRRAEERLRACGVLGPDEEISGAVEVVSFDDSVGEPRQVVQEGLGEDRCRDIPRVRFERGRDRGGPEPRSSESWGGGS